MRLTGTWLLGLMLVGVLLPRTAWGYDPEVHQRLTFYAAKALNRCLAERSVPGLTPLEVRFIATSNMGLANSNALVRFFRWSYFDVAEHDDRRLLWLINTRFTSHFESSVKALSRSREPSERYRELGRIVSYI